MDLGLTNKKAIVLGASAGIGLAIAKELAQEGAHLALGARQMEALERAARESNAYFFDVCDVGQADSLLHFLNGAKNALGGLDVLVVNTGGPDAGQFLEINDEQWEKNFENLWMGMVRSIRFALPLMQENRWGRILLVASTSAKETIDRLTISNGFRAGLLGLLKSISREVAKDGITMNAVLPGRILTARLQALHSGSSEAQMAQGVPVGRLGNPDEIAALATFLLSARASYVTGQAIACDGGLLRSI